VDMREVKEMLKEFKKSDKNFEGIENSVNDEGGKESRTRQGERFKREEEEEFKSGQGRQSFRHLKGLTHTSGCLRWRNSLRYKMHLTKKG